MIWKEHAFAQMPNQNVAQLSFRDIKLRHSCNFLISNYVRFLFLAILGPSIPWIIMGTCRGSRIKAKVSIALSMTKRLMLYVVHVMTADP
jgi:hypothetical protein